MDLERIEHQKEVVREWLDKDNLPRLALEADVLARMIYAYFYEKRIHDSKGEK